MLAAQIQASAQPPPSGVPCPAGAARVVTGVPLVVPERPGSGLSGLCQKLVHADDVTVPGLR